jgi:transposase
MAFIACRTSRGKKYWSIVESRRVNGKPRQVILEYLGTAETLLERLQDKGRISLRSYSHGDTHALLTIAREMDLIEIINRHIPAGKNGKRPVRDGMTVGASLVLAAIGRACQPTSKMGWYQWCKRTSMEYCLRASLRGLDSQHFWDQMGWLREEKIRVIEEDIVKRMVEVYRPDLTSLLFDSSNFFTFIDSNNGSCSLARRGQNKQKRSDLRQIGLALLITRKHQFPLFHKTYEGNKNDVTVFKETLDDIVARLRSLSQQLADITLVFDKGNNSRDNFQLLDREREIGYVGGLVPCYFKDLLRQANQHFQMITIDGEAMPVYRVRRKVWGCERTCVVVVSRQLREGQIKGIHQHLERKYRELESFRRQLENPRRTRSLGKQEITRRLTKIMKGQFIEDILRYDLIEREDGGFSFICYIDSSAFQRLKQEVLGRRILVTNRHDWSSEEIILAYRGQAKIEYAFRNLKNPYHLSVRPQYHWTDQKIRAHIFICVIGYLLTIAAYTKATEKAGYRNNISAFVQDLRSIRLASTRRHKSNRVIYQLEAIPRRLGRLARAFAITDDNIRTRLDLSVYS